MTNHATKPANIFDIITKDQCSKLREIGFVIIHTEPTKEMWDAFWSDPWDCEFEKSFHRMVVASIHHQNIDIKNCEDIVLITYPWQPIETAPKDGTHILIYGDLDYGGMTVDPDTKIIVACYDENNNPPWMSVACCDGVTCYKATHWMPISKPISEVGR